MPLRGKQAKVPLRESRPEGAITCQPRATPWGSSYHSPAGEYALTAKFGLGSAKLRQKVSGTFWHFWESFQCQPALVGASVARAQVGWLVGFMPIGSPDVGHTPAGFSRRICALLCP
jgi:hypothetical protein